MNTFNTIDKKKSKKNVTDFLKIYKEILYTFPLINEPDLNEKYQFIQPRTVNEYVSIDKQQVHDEREKILSDRDTILNQVHNAIDNLLPDERYIIVTRYIKGNYKDDFNIYSDLGIGRTNYYKIKDRALIRMALILELEIYKGGGNK
ncbi:hypothetical protein BFS35_002300 [Macrococcoides goetzii]|uniref:Transcriptional regulator n=1 Tax=Macrococcoides goetzii TaxID=1891097 RepID=A0A2G5NSV8_9STAP|nr:ArpU family phage packaging/lysis transcriptional regulator [Macrococcus goetzii]RAI82540.1 hypothetical protein BFS35_002300 [Macrococcus goetzii]